MLCPVKFLSKYLEPVAWNTAFTQSRQTGKTGTTIHYSDIGACAHYSKIANPTACLPVHICRPFTLNLWFLKWGPGTLGGP